jgi:ribonuclease HI
MGFRDLHAFNLAMIAKQGWNILTKPHTLVAKLYKARYFPNSTLFDSKIGHNPSYAWRGIWNARQILMNGCRWSVGNGASINVMSDPWLRGIEGAWIPSPQVQGVHNFNVNDLMIPNVKVWDKEKIESIFPLHIATRILAIPLFDMVENDKLVWVDSTHGQYSVKSGYKLMLHVTGKVEVMSQQDDWNSLWKILAPPKAKHLLWRISKGCLPTRMRLQEKHVSCPLLCPICNQEFEDEWHVFFSCEASIQARQAAGLEHVLQHRLQQANSTRDIIHSICSVEDNSTAGLFAMMIWVLWNNRNNKVWSDISEPGRSLGLKSKYLWDDWHMVQEQQHVLHHSEQQQQRLTWEKPMSGWYKCNIDAAFHQAINKTSTGWCLRDHLGRFILAETTWMVGSCSIVEGESIALLEALKVMRQRGISQVIFETDSKSVVDAIHHFHGGSSEFSVIISNINNILSCNPNFMVKFIRRQANMVAHTLARAAISWSSRCTFETLPICITRLLNNEMI